MAEKFLEAGDIPAAAMTFGMAGDYLDARARSFAIWDEIAFRENISASSMHSVTLKLNGTVVAVGSNHSDRCDVEKWTDIVAVSSGESHIVGLKSDGTVVAAGENKKGQCDVSGWTGIKVPR